MILYVLMVTFHLSGGEVSIPKSIGVFQVKMQCEDKIKTLMTQDDYKNLIKIDKTIVLKCIPVPVGE